MRAQSIGVLLMVQRTRVSSRELPRRVYHRMAKRPSLTNEPLMYGLDLKRRWCPLVTGHSSPAVPDSLSLIGLDIEEDDLDPNPVTQNPVPSGSTASSLAYLVQSHEWPRLFRHMANYVKVCQIDERWFNSLLALLPDALHACRLTSCPLDVQQAIIILSYLYEPDCPKLFALFVKALQSGEPSDDSLSELTSLPSCSNACFDRT